MTGSTEFEKIAKARKLEYRPTDSEGAINLELLNASLDTAISSAKDLKLGNKTIDGLRHLRNSGSVSEKINFVHGDGMYLLYFDPSQPHQVLCHTVYDGVVYYEVAIVYDGIIFTYRRLKVLQHLECKVLPRP